MKEVVVIGGGIAGMQVAISLAQRGISTTIIEKKDKLGGNVANWDRLFPNQRRAEEIISILYDKVIDSKLITVYTDTNVQHIERKKDDNFEVILSNNKKLMANAVSICCGFDLFRAERKEEYGYGIYDNVITSADLEKMFSKHKVVCADNSTPKRVAFVHCVGSRDEKVNNNYCSKVCCVTAVKQACEIKEMYPETEVFNLYMDLRMFDRYFENMYHVAQSQYGVTFIRGRLSEVAVDHDNKVIIKTEDTLVGKPLKMAVDLLVLMVGMQNTVSNNNLFEKLNLKTDIDHFLEVKDLFLGGNCSKKEGIFIAGACSGPKSVPDTIADARSAAEDIFTYIKKGV